MRSNRLGCFSASAIFSALITLFVITGIALARGNDMFSAGPLNAQPGAAVGGVSAHAEIEACSACHPAPWDFSERMNDRCMICHTDISVQQTDAASLHGAIQNRTPNLDCAKCHPEHRGPGAPLTRVENGDFPHETLGYSLAAHARKSDRAPFACSDCHAQDIALFDQAVCADCHRQMDAAFTTAHMLGWGDNCLACHDGIDTYGAHFDHSQVGFALEGGHAEVICTKCHLDARTLADLKSAPTDCYSCHRQDDDHDGRFGADCSACHTANGWEPASFDHDLAAFKLEGKHTETSCDQCHVNGQYKGTPSDCYSCHRQDDEHNGQYGQDCGGCHNPFDWEDASFDHSLSSFPLTGAHTGLACERCHVNNQFAGVSAACVSCHADPEFHAGMFGRDCATCHSTSDWYAPYYGSHPGIADEGGRGVNHGGASCRDCHTANLYTATCTACHDSNNPDDDGGEGGDD
ncbi:MAG: cytochrome c3 family protein [Chloroflexota bacterium]